MHNKVKSETCLAVTSAKRVGVFQASISMGLVWEEAGAQLFTKDNKHSTPQGTKCLCEGYSI